MEKTKNPVLAQEARQYPHSSKEEALFYAECMLDKRSRKQVNYGLEILARAFEHIHPAELELQAQEGYRYFLLSPKDVASRNYLPTHLLAGTKFTGKIVYVNVEATLTVRKDMLVGMPEVLEDFHRLSSNSDVLIFTRDPKDPQFALIYDAKKKPLLNSVGQQKRLDTSVPNGLGAYVDRELGYPIVHEAGHVLAHLLVASRKNSLPKTKELMYGNQDIPRESTLQWVQGKRTALTFTNGARLSEYGETSSVEWFPEAYRIARDAPMYDDPKEIADAGGVRAFGEMREPLKTGYFDKLPEAIEQDLSRQKNRKWQYSANKKVPKQRGIPLWSQVASPVSKILRHFDGRFSKDTKILNPIARTRLLSVSLDSTVKEEICKKETLSSFSKLDGIAQERLAYSISVLNSADAVRLLNTDFLRNFDKCSGDLQDDVTRVLGSEAAIVHKDMLSGMPEALDEFNQLSPKEESLIFMRDPLGIPETFPRAPLIYDAKGQALKDSEGQQKRLNLPTRALSDGIRITLNTCKTGQIRKGSLLLPDVITNLDALVSSARKNIINGLLYGTSEDNVVKILNRKFLNDLKMCKENVQEAISSVVISSDVPQNTKDALFDPLVINSSNDRTRETLELAKKLQDTKISTPAVQPESSTVDAYSQGVGSLYELLGEQLIARANEQFDEQRKECRSLRKQLRQLRREENPGVDLSDWSTASEDEVEKTRKRQKSQAGIAPRDPTADEQTSLRPEGGTGSRTPTSRLRESFETAPSRRPTPAPSGASLSASIQSARPSQPLPSTPKQTKERMQ